MPSDPQFYCTRCHQLVPPTQVGLDGMTGERIHINDSIHPNTDCEGTLVDTSPSDTSPHAFEALLLDQVKDSQPSLTDSPPHLARQHLQQLQMVAQAALTFRQRVDKKLKDTGLTITHEDIRDAFLLSEVETLLNKLDITRFLTPFPDHQCPQCSVTLIPSGLADASLLCPLCLRRFASPTEPSTIPESQS